MKFFIVIILMLFTACSAGNSAKPDKKSADIPNKEFISYPLVTEKEVVLGESATRIIDSGENRVTNISLACNKINGKVLKPNDEFSFNLTTGERTAANGYKIAPVIYKGRKAYGTGGGVCQVSTTVYQAAKNAGFEIVEQHCHSEPVAYAEKGMDAAVVFGAKDLKFKNNVGEPIYIYAWVEEEKVFVKIIKKSVDIQQ